MTVLIIIGAVVLIILTDMNRIFILFLIITGFSKAQINMSIGNYISIQTQKWTSQTSTKENGLITGGLDNFIKASIAHGYWTSFDRIWIFAVDIQANSCIPINNPTASAATQVNAPTFTAKQGFNGDGSTKYINTNFNPNTQGINFTQNNACHYLYCRSAGTNATQYDAGNSNSVVPICYNDYALKWSDGKCYSVTNQNANNGTGGFTNASAAGFWALNRTSSTATEIFKNAVSQKAWSETSNTIPNLNDYVCAVNGNPTILGFSTKQFSVRALGSVISSTALSYFSTDINYYMTQLGTNVY